MLIKLPFKLFRSVKPEVESFCFRKSHSLPATFITHNCYYSAKMMWIRGESSYSWFGLLHPWFKTLAFGIDSNEQQTVNHLTL